MTILFKCDKVIRSIKNKIVKKGERKSMKKRKYLALLLAAGMIAQTALSTGGVVQVQAAEDCSKSGLFNTIFLISLSGCHSVVISRIERPSIVFLFVL